jgi:hypothetical protein
MTSLGGLLCRQVLSPYSRTENGGWVVNALMTLAQRHPDLLGGR